METQLQDGRTHDSTPSPDDRIICLCDPPNRSMRLRIQAVLFVCAVLGPWGLEPWGLYQCGISGTACGQTVDKPTGGGPAEIRPAEMKPFPLNRVVDFYAKQAKTYLSSEQPIPPILPQYPGMDGGGFGHWGQNSEESSADHTLNQVDTGNVVAHVIHHFGSVTNKGVAVQLGAQGGQSVLFDPERLTFVDAWKDGFLFRHAGRFGTMGGVRTEGPRTFDMTAGEWSGPESVDRKYIGIHRRGTDACFRYRIGGAEVRDYFTAANGGLLRTIHVEGVLPEGVLLRLLKLSEPKTETGNGSQVVSGLNVNSQCVVAMKSGTSNGESPQSVRGAAASLPRLFERDGIVTIEPSRAASQTFSILIAAIAPGEAANTVVEQQTVG